MPTTLSIVIPVFNEVESLPTLQQELSAVAAEHEYQLEVVFVDDGSTDGSWEVVQRLAGEDAAVQGVRLRRNFGKAAALSAGVAASSAPIVITMDADLQDDPAEIPRFLDALGNELDLVSGWKRTRHDPWHKVGPSRVFNGLVGAMTGVRLHDHNCGFKCYRREVFDEIRLYGERHRFIPVLAEARGFRIGEIEVHHRPRQFGKSKYGMRRFVKGFLDLLTVYFLTGFGQRPQHLMGTLGLLCFLLGGTGLGILSIWRIISWQVDTLEPIHLHERAVFYYSIVAVLLGAQFMTIGFLAEMITESCGKDQQPYSIKERTRP
jgi:dolichol-phosphate mannosyltransferase